MTMNAAIVISAQANQAKAELRATAAEVEKLRLATGAAGSEARSSARDFAAEGQALSSAKDGAESTSAETERLASAMGAAGEQARNSAGSFAAGAQGIAEIEETAAAAAAGQGLLGEMTDLAADALSGLALTIAIAAGSALIAWLFASGEEVKSLDDAVVDLKGSVEDLAAQGRIDLQSLKEDFGAVTPEVIRLQQQITQLAEVQAINDLRAAIASLKAEAEGTWLALFNDNAMTDVDQAAKLLGVVSQIGTSGRAAPVTNPVVAEFQATLESLNAAKGPTEQLAIFKDLNAQFADATGGIQQMDVAQSIYYGSILATEEGLRRMVQTQKDVARAQEEIARAKNIDNGRMGGPMAFDAKPPQDNFSADLVQANQLLATLQAQASVQQLINQYGEESAQVAGARAEAERAAFAEMVAGLDVAEALKLELLAAFDAANGLASVNFSAMLAPAVELAANLAQNIAAAATAAWTANQYVADNQVGGKSYIANQYALYGAGKAASATAWRETDPLYGAPPAPPKVSTGTGASSGGGGAAKAEADAVGELITKLQEEYDLLLEVDPVKKEMLRYREQLADASDAERQSVEDLIRAEQTLNATREIGQQFSDMAADFLDQVFAKGARAIDVIRDLGATLASTLARSFITGEGPWASILGISGGLFAPQAKAEGGLIHGPGGPTDDMVPVAASAGEFMVNAQATAQNLPLLEAINSGEDLPAAMQDAASFQTPAYASRAADPGLGEIQERAGGGMIYGPGGPTDDQVLMWGSAGEYMVNAEATSRHRPLLEMINAGGDIPGFAKGGPIGGSTAPSAPFGGGKSPMHLTFSLAGAKGNAEIERIVVGAIETALTHFDREVLPLRVNDIASGGMVFG